VLVIKLRALGLLGKCSTSELHSLCLQLSFLSFMLKFTNFIVLFKELGFHFYFIIYYYFIFCLHWVHFSSFFEIFLIHKFLIKHCFSGILTNFDMFCFHFHSQYPSQCLLIFLLIHSLLGFSRHVFNFWSNPVVIMTWILLHPLELVFYWV
jgi:hypothetical protein